MEIQYLSIPGGKEWRYNISLYLEVKNGDTISLYLEVKNGDTISLYTWRMISNHGHFLVPCLFNNLCDLRHSLTFHELLLSVFLI